MDVVLLDSVSLVLCKKTVRRVLFKLRDDVRLAVRGHSRGAHVTGMCVEG